MPPYAKKPVRKPQGDPQRRSTNADRPLGTRMPMPAPSQTGGTKYLPSQRKTPYVNPNYLQSMTPTPRHRGPDWDASGYHPHVSGQQSFAAMATQGRPAGPSNPVQGIRTRMELIKANAISRKTEEARRAHAVHSEPPVHHGNDDRKADMASKKKRKDKDWVQEVDKEMEKDGTEGSFTRAAKKAGKSVHAYAIEVRSKYKGKDGLTEAQKRLLRRAVLALNFEKMAKK